jgi:hypothetical protein
MDSITRVFEYRSDNRYTFVVEDEYSSCNIALQKVSIKKDWLRTTDTYELNYTIYLPATYQSGASPTVFTIDVDQTNPITGTIPLRYQANFQGLAYDREFLLTYKNAGNDALPRKALKIFTQIENNFLVVNVQGVHTHFTIRATDSLIFRNSLINSTPYATAIKPFSFQPLDSAIGLTFGANSITAFNMKWTRCILELPNAIIAVPAVIISTDLPLISKTNEMQLDKVTEYVAFDAIFNDTNNRIIIYEPTNMIYKKCSKFSNFTISILGLEKHSTICITLSIRSYASN